MVESRMNGKGGMGRRGGILILVMLFVPALPALLPSRLPALFTLHAQHAAFRV
jgi:hypothetical protein